MLIADRFSKMAHFVACHKANDGSHVIDLYLKEIIRLHGVPRTIVSDKDTNFYPTFGEVYVICWVLTSSTAPLVPD